jgi:tetratricopeptide (TPR) repeat protein
MKSQRWIPFVLVITALAAAAAGCSRSAQSYLERGNAQLDKGNLEAAVLEYRNAIQKDATFAPARVKLAEAYLRQRNFAGALGEAVRAADLLPNDVEAQIRAGSLLFAAGRNEDAKARTEKALAVNPKSADAMTLRAGAMARLGDLDGAIEQLRQAIAIDASAGRQANLGQLLDAKGLTQEAEASFRQAIATDAKSVDVQIALARFLSGQKRTAEAESGFKAALALDPANLAANAALADFYVASSRPADAEPYIKKLTEAGDNPVPALALADYYVGMKREADAFAVLEKLSASPRAWAVARSRTAALLYAEGKTAEGHRAIDEVIAKYPAYAEARVMRGRFLLAEGKTDQALVEAQEAVKSDPRSAEGHYLAGIAHEAKRDLAAAAASFNEVLRLTPRSLPAQLRLASLDLRLGNLTTATQLAEQVVQRDPSVLEAQVILTRSLLGRGDLTRAAAAAKALVERFPQSGLAQNEAGLVALGREDRAGARAAFEKALALDATLVEPLVWLVRLDLADKQVARARGRVEARLKAAPNSSAVLVLAGQTWASSQDTAKAEEFFLRAIQADASNLDAFQRLAFLYMSQKRLDEALAQFEKLAVQQPKATGPQTMAALILEAQGKQEEAAQRYERIVQADARAAVASNNLAWRLASRGEQLDRALQLAQAAKAELPDVPAINDTLAYVYIKKQLGALAVPLLKQAIAKQAADKQPEDPSYFYHLGLALSQTGDKAGAREALDRALRLKADFEGAEDARQVLKTLG